MSKKLLENFLIEASTQEIAFMVKENRVPIILITDEIDGKIEKHKEGLLIKTTGNTKVLYNQLLSIQDRIKILEECLMIEKHILSKLN